MKYQPLPDSIHVQSFMRYGTTCQKKMISESAHCFVRKFRSHVSDLIPKLIFQTTELKVTFSPEGWTVHQRRIHSYQSASARHGVRHQRYVVSTSD